MGFRAPIPAMNSMSEYILPFECYSWPPSIRRLSSIGTQLTEKWQPECTSVPELNRKQSNTFQKYQSIWVFFEIVYLHSALEFKEI